MSSYKRYILYFILLFIYSNVYAVQNLIGECDTEDGTSCQFNKIYNNKFFIKDFIELVENSECYPFQDYDKKYEAEYNNSIKTIKTTKNLRQKNNKDRILQLIPKLRDVTINNNKESIQYQTSKNVITLIPHMLNKGEIIEGLLGDELIENVELFLKEINMQPADNKYIQLLRKTHVLNNSIVNLAQEYLNECDNDSDCKKGALLYTQADSNLVKTESMTYISPKIVNKYGCQNNPNLFLCIMQVKFYNIEQNIMNTITYFNDKSEEIYSMSTKISNIISTLSKADIKQIIATGGITMYSYEYELQTISKLGYFANNNFGGRKNSLNKQNKDTYNKIINNYYHLGYEDLLDKYDKETKQNIYVHTEKLEERIKNFENYKYEIKDTLATLEEEIANIYSYSADKIMNIVSKLKTLVSRFF